VVGKRVSHFSNHKSESGTKAAPLKFVTATLPKPLEVGRHWKPQLPSSEKSLTGRPSATIVFVHSSSTARHYEIEIERGS
jgi:hypothetical protein